MKTADLYASVTDTIIKQLEQGTVPWTRPWTIKGGGIMPRNYATSLRKLRCRIFPLHPLPR